MFLIRCDVIHCNQTVHATACSGGLGLPDGWSRVEMMVEVPPAPPPYPISEILRQAMDSTADGVQARMLAAQAMTAKAMEQGQAWASDQKPCFMPKTFVVCDRHEELFRLLIGPTVGKVEP